MNTEQKKILVKAIEEVSPWERIPTSIDGIFLVKTPEHNNSYTILVELNPSVNYPAMKKKGLYLKNINEYEGFKKLLNNEKVKELIEVINEYYGKHQSPRIEI